MAAKALITPKAITAALPDVKTRAELLKTIGVALSASNYERLDRVAHLNGIVLPGKTNTGKRGSRPALRTSPIWDRERLEGAIIGARDMREVLARLGLDRSARPRLHVAASAYGLVLPHGTGGPDREKQRREAVQRTFKKGSHRIGGHRLKRLIRGLDLLPYLCSVCDQSPTWNNQPLVLQIDHINGDAADNRLENLRFLCPNCHSQTDTFAGRNCGRSTVGNGVMAARAPLKR
jgi:hypothetical protein